MPIYHKLVFMYLDSLFIGDPGLDIECVGFTHYTLFLVGDCWGNFHTSGNR